MPRNTSLADRLADREPLVGIVLKMPNPALIEQASALGFDVVVIDTEHGMADGDQLEHHLRAADSAGIHSLVRVGGATAIETLRALDAGADGVIYPHIVTAADAQLAVSHAHYPPLGRRGLAASTRAGRYGTVSVREHLDRSARETVVIAQIEDADAVLNAQSIAATPGINGIWIGPGDLSMSMGHPGEAGHPEVVEAIHQVVDVVRTRTRAAVAVLVRDSTDVEEWRSGGPSLYLVTVTDLFAEPARNMVKARDELSADESHPSTAQA